MVSRGRAPSCGPPAVPADGPRPRGRPGSAAWWRAQSADGGVADGPRVTIGALGRPARACGRLRRHARRDGASTLDLEASWWRYAGTKDAAIRDRCSTEEPVGVLPAARVGSRRPPAMSYALAGVRRLLIASAPCAGHARAAPRRLDSRSARRSWSGLTSPIARTEERPGRPGETERVELRGLEPLTLSLRTRCATSCATAPARRPVSALTCAIDAKRKASTGPRRRPESVRTASQRGLRSRRLPRRSRPCATYVGVRGRRPRPHGPARSRPRSGRRSRRRWSRGRWCGRCGGPAAWRRTSASVTGTGSQRPSAAAGSAGRPGRSAGGPPTPRGRRRSRSVGSVMATGRQARSFFTISRQATSQATSRAAGIATYGQARRPVAQAATTAARASSSTERTRRRRLVARGRGERRAAYCSSGDGSVTRRLGRSRPCRRRGRASRRGGPSGR